MAELCRRLASIPTSGGHRADRVLRALAGKLDREAALAGKLDREAALALPDPEGALAEHPAAKSSKRD